MSWLLEDPTTVLAVGALSIVLLVVALVNTRRPAFLLGIGGVLAAMLVCLVIEWAWVTPREEVAADLETLASLVEANRTAEALAYLDPHQPFERPAAEVALRQFVFREVTISDLEIEVQRRQPPTAKVEMVVVASFDDRQGRNPYNRIIRRFQLAMRRDADHWVITKYEHSGLGEER